jgi:cytidylate kinase
MAKIITIDGPASVGKSEVAKKLSKKYNAPILYSGRLYRAIALEVVNKKINIKNTKEIIKCASNINETILKSHKLYSDKIDKISSQISSIKELRLKLIKYQRSFPKKQLKSKKYVIIEGRDIGTVIFPKANHKIFMWASSKARAGRRVKQIGQTKKTRNISQIHQLIIARDMRDMTRKFAPLIPAADSHLLDTTFLDIEQTFNAIVKIINKKK